MLSVLEYVNEILGHTITDVLFTRRTGIRATLSNKIIEANNMTRIAKIQSLVERVHELEEKCQTFVSFVDVTRFLLLCQAAGILAYGGAFSRDMTGQYFYV